MSKEKNRETNMRTSHKTVVTMAPEAAMLGGLAAAHGAGPGAPQPAENPQRPVMSLEAMTDALSLAEIRTDVRCPLNIALPVDTRERFRRLTRQIKINGKPLVSVLFRLEAERTAKEPGYLSRKLDSHKHCA
jgi:hypothetical protein